MTAATLEVRDLSLQFGRVVALERVSCSVRAGELFAVIGPNGAGKSSLLNVLSRVYEPQSGEVLFAGEDLLRISRSALAGRGIARSFQNLGLIPDLTALENVLVGRHHLMRAGVVRGGLPFGLARQEERAHRVAARAALAFFDALEVAHRPTGVLPYGVQKRVELARCLAMEPRLLLLDEPVAGMSAGERAEITDLVRRLHAEHEVTILLVEHDMDMVMAVADRVLVLDFGRVLALGTPSDVQHDARVIRAYLGGELAASA